MEGGFFEDIRSFFPEEKRSSSSCVPVVTTAVQLTTASDYLNQGICPDEESVDFSALLEAYNSETSTTTSTTPRSASSVTGAISAGNHTAPTQDTITSNANFPSFRSFLTGEPFSLSHTTMYGSDSYHGAANPLQGGQVEMSPSPPSIGVDCIGVPSTPSPHVVQIESSPGSYPAAMRPAPGKAKSGKGHKKQSPDKNSHEYRQKRDRNNVAVRKSREKSKIRVMDTERRVKDLEEENSQLQSKIALLTKELNVLKSLFTSAGVSQPPSLLKEEGILGHK